MQRSTVNPRFSKGYFSISLLIFLSVTTTLTLTITSLIREYHLFLNAQLAELKHFALALSGIRYAKHTFDDIPFTKETEPSLEHIKQGLRINLDDSSFSVIKNDSFIYSISTDNRYSSSLRCRYRIVDDTLEFSDLSAYDGD